MPANDRPITRRQALALLGSTVAVSSVPPLLSTASTERSPTSFYESTVTALMEEYDIRGVSAAIVPTNGASEASPVYRDAFGIDRRLQDGTDQQDGLLTPAYRLRLASVVKSLTATAVLRLIDAGVLAASDRVFGDGGILPPDTWGDPESPCPLRIRHLLNHEYRVVQEQSADWTRVVYQVDEELTLPEMVARIHEEYTVEIPRDLSAPAAPCDPPDDEYYNYGYGVLGAVVDTVVGGTGFDQGRSFESFVKERVLAPAGATDVDTVETAHGAVENEAYHHSKDGDPYGDWLARHRSWGWSGWAATPLAIARFGQWVISGAPFATDVVSEYTDLTDYGWFSFDGGRLVGIDGSQVGIVAGLRGNPDRTFCVLVNTRHDESWGDATPGEEIVARTADLARALI